MMNWMYNSKILAYTSYFALLHSNGGQKKQNIQTHNIYMHTITNRIKIGNPGCSGFEDLSIVFKTGTSYLKIKTVCI